MKLAKRLDQRCATREKNDPVENQRKRYLKLIPNNDTPFEEFLKQIDPEHSVINIAKRELEEVKDEEPKPESQKKKVIFKSILLPKITNLDKEKMGKSY